MTFPFRRMLTVASATAGFKNIWEVSSNRSRVEDPEAHTGWQGSVALEFRCAPRRERVPEVENDGKVRNPSAIEG